MVIRPLLPVTELRGEGIPQSADVPAAHSVPGAMHGNLPASVRATSTCKVGTMYSSCLQMRKMRLREVKCLAKEHTAVRNVNPDRL